MGTALIVVAQVILHKNFKCFQVQTPDHLRVEMERSGGGLAHVTDTLIKHKVTVLALRADENNGRVVADITLRLPRDYSMAKLLELMDGHPCVKGVEL